MSTTDVPTEQRATVRRSTAVPSCFDLDSCAGCRRCAQECPCGAITMEPETI